MTKIDNMLGKILHKGNTNTPFKGYNLQPHTSMGYRMLTPNVGYRQPIVNPVNRVMGNIISDKKSKGMAFFESPTERAHVEFEHNELDKNSRRRHRALIEKQIAKIPVTKEEEIDSERQFGEYIGYNKALADLKLIKAPLHGRLKERFGVIKKSNHPIAFPEDEDVSKNRKTVENGRVIWNPDEDDNEGVFDLKAEMEWDDWGQSEENDKKAKYGLDDIFGEDNGQIVEERNGYALIRFHDSYSPSSEHPDVWQIRHGKHTVWTSGTTDMAEFIHEGVGTHEVGSSLRKEAKEHFNKIAGR
jgi:hypothetical protein